MKLPFFLASRFVAAENIDSALPIVEELNARGLHVTLDLLGEYVKDRDVALAALGTYTRLLHTLAGRTSDPNISIKLSMLGQKIDYDFGLANLKTLLALAKEKGVFVRLDMEGSDITESTLSMFEAVYPEHGEHVGVVLQAYLKRTARDVERMCALKARVRLCKGAYKEPAEIAYQKMDEIRAHYVDYMQALITHARYPGIATHDDLLIDATKRFVAEKAVSREAFEFQMLYGIRTDTQAEIAGEGYNMRVYVPYGTDWYPYFSRRLRERKENVWFVVRNLVRH